MVCNIPTCSLCLGHQIEEQQSVLRGDKAPPAEPGFVQVAFTTKYVCECGKVHDTKPICGGQIKKIWKNGKLHDCVCEECGASHGAGALERERLLQSFQEV